MLKRLNAYNEFIESVEVVVPVREETVRNDHSYKPMVESTQLDRQKSSYYPIERDDLQGADILKVLRSTLGFSQEISSEPLLQDLSGSLKGLSIEGGELDIRDSETGGSETEGPVVQVIGHVSGDQYVSHRQPMFSDYALRPITNRIGSKILYCKRLQCKLYRVFNNGNFNYGGRFYGAEYQQLSGKERRSMLINGSKVVEADYSAFHIRMIYHLVGIDKKENP